MSGRSCVIDGVTGQYLDTVTGEVVHSAPNQPQVLVLDTCGVVPHSAKFGAQIWMVADSLNSAFSNPEVTAAGGQYRLCWCPGMALNSSSFATYLEAQIQNWTQGATNNFTETLELLNQQQSCELPEHFRVDFGKLELLGPTLDQDRTCVSGESCPINVMGNGLSQDVVMLMETCATKAAPTPFQVLGDGVVNGVLHGVLPDVSVGQYRLCWCSQLESGSCEPPFLSLDFGQLQVLGPSGGQEKTCVSGLTCVLDDLEGLETVGGVEGEVMVLETCGVGRSVDGFPGARSVSEGAVLWEIPITARGGIYRLCWRGWRNLNDNETSITGESGETNAVSTSTDFRTDFGALTVIGALLFDQDRTCISGRRCHIDGLRGLHFSEKDIFQVLDTCSVGIMGTMVPSWPGTAATHVSSEVSGVSGTAVSWERVSSPGGVYRLCWCSSSASQVDCPNSIDIGSMTLIGISPGVHRTCIAGQTCSVDGLVTTFGHLSSHFLIAETCGKNDGIHRFSDFGAADSVQQSGSMIYWSPASANGGVYRLCWCGSNECRSEEFVDAGTLDVIGPKQGQDGTCVSGHRCWLSIDGHHLQTGDLISVLDTCSHVVQPARMQNDASLSIQNFSIQVSWDRLTFAGGEYRLCWCPDEESLCNGQWVDFGNLKLLGPYPLSQHRTCISGQSCNLLEITSFVHFGPESHLFRDHILVMDTCGKPSTLPRFPSKGIAELSTSISNFSQSSATLFSLHTFEAGWQIPVTAAAGRYRLCWCSHLSETCESSQPSSTHVDIGLFTLVGPTPLSQDRTCVSGQSCRLSDWSGVDLGVSNHVLVMHTCGTPALAKLPNEIHNTTYSISLSPGGNFRLCWCAHDHFSCSLSTDFHTDIGGLHLIGPEPLTQDRTCISGQRCVLRDITGISLGHDKLALMDTCGEIGVTVPRFPTFARLEVLDPNVASYSWDVISAAGGTYQLCWCGEFFGCEASDAFKVRIGHLQLLGPSPDQSRTCVTGRSCTLQPLEGIWSQDLRDDFKKLFKALHTTWLL